MWDLYFRISLYLRIGITTDNHCFVIVCDRSMTIPRCFETSIFSPFIVLKFCYNVDVKWTFIASSNNESSIICWSYRILIYFARKIVCIIDSLEILFPTYAVKGKFGASVHWLVLKLYNSLLTWHEELEYDPVVNAKPL